MRLDPGYRKKASEAIRRRLARGEIIGLMRPEVQAKAIASRMANGTLAPPGSGRGICGFRKDLSHYCRSTFEANFARILCRVGIPYEYEPNFFRLPSGVYYMPDFWLHASFGPIPAGWVELKGWRFPDGRVHKSEKIEEFQKEHGNVFVLAERDPVWKMLVAEHKPQLSLWEHPNCNLRTHPILFGR